MFESLEVAIWRLRVAEVVVAVPVGVAIAVPIRVAVALRGVLIRPTATVLVLVIRLTIQEARCVGALRRGLHDVVTGEASIGEGLAEAIVASPMRRCTDHTVAMSAAVYACASIRGDWIGSTGAEKTGIVFLDLAGDAATVWGVTNEVHKWANVLDEDWLDVFSSEVHSCLNHIVREGVAKHAFELHRHHDLTDQHALHLLWTTANTLLDHVRAELLLRHVAHVSAEGETQRLGEAWLGQIDDVLNDVVAEGILDKREGVVDNVIDQSTLLQAGSMINTALKHTAAVAVGTDRDTVSADRIEDELSILGSEMIETLLDDMVAVKILDELHHIPAKRFDDHVPLLLESDGFNHPL